MNQRIKLNGKLKTYLRWPIILTFMLICMNISIYFVSRNAGLIMSVYVVIYLIISIGLYYYKRPSILSELVRYAADYGQVQKQLLKELSIPYAVLDAEGRLLWGNNEFLDLIENEKIAKKSITNIFPTITKGAFPNIESDEEIHIQHRECNYRIVLRKVIAESFQANDSWDNDTDIEADGMNDKNALIAMYVYDETEIISYIKEIKEQRLIVGLLYIDNYEEALESIDEVRRSLLIALVDRKINKYMQNIDAIIKKLEKDKYIILFKQKYLAQLQTNKFSILDEVRAINIGNDMAVTLSIGLGINADTYLTGYEYARAAIDLALGRGGDQAVVKDSERILYYGGKSIQVEKSTRVKARVKAHALKELVEAKEKVVIMGHSIGDVDCFGASIGIYRIARTLGKKAHIVINEVTKSVRPIMNRFVNNPDYEEDMFLNGQKAMDIVDNNTLLIIVDVNRPSYTECEELLSLTKTIVILDHHRQCSEAVENAVLSYIEPYASSTCEMVAEVLQYIGEGLKLKQAESDAMYAGIIIDTNNFLNKTGVRTFEAAAFLRRSGADVTRIRKVFRSDVDDYKARADAMARSEIFLEHYAFAICSSDSLDSPTIVAAQIANELLDITNIKASFVLTEFNNKIYISARSIDELNVQVVMEKLGGGGHQSVAGAQLTDTTIEEARNMVKEVLETMKMEGDL
ncbi:DHH family phosphoesterase [Anaeromicropila herbilytica]|uniref:Cyclic-di-AMP phosphodiesterase n=1 Tax=Anaeromicropila herbilytica TaxID=2785025 RepID=A0A7R7EQB8_9FIRM|nr:DHH family phosphoesterase [Anaeromicropila herbilytica]BCN32836.1 phosphoesterase [Anaeromicropila herbilytica]